MKNFIPSHLQIETVNRQCNARCPMCTIQFVPDYEAIPEDHESHTGWARPAEIMPLARFEKIIDRMKKYTREIKYISLHGCGEPLLDKTLADKVRYARMAGFRNVGFTSNCSALTPAASEKLLEAGLTCLIQNCYHDVCGRFSTPVDIPKRSYHCLDAEWTDDFLEGFWLFLESMRDAHDTHRVFLDYFKERRSGESSRMGPAFWGTV